MKSRSSRSSTSIGAAWISALSSWRCKQRRAGEVEFTAEAHHDPVGLAPDLDPQMLLSRHEPMVAQGFAQRADLDLKDGTRHRPAVG